MSLNNKTAEHGTFRKRQGFTMASNAAIRDPELSLNAKGLLHADCVLGCLNVHHPVR